MLRPFVPLGIKRHKSSKSSAMRSQYTFPVAAGTHSRIEVFQQDELVAWGGGRGGGLLYESVEFLVESVLCLVAAGKSGGVCAGDCGMSGEVEWEAEFHQPLAHWCWEVW